jgi:hypothetical protein
MFFVLGAALSWGIYGPALQKGAHGLGHGSQAELELGRMKAFLCVGVAYFVMAVIYPVIMLAKDGKLGEFAGAHMTGTLTATFSGVMGAAGALCVILAFGAGGSPVYVMPLIFGIAPVVNVLVTYLWDKAEGKSWPVPEWPFFAGIALAGLGASLVLAYKPAPAKPTAAGKPPAVAAAPSAVAPPADPAAK